MLLPEEIEKYFDKLWPICRSITGNGLRESLSIINEIAPLKITEVPTGSKVFDWEIPKEWNISDAYIITPAGEKICDFKLNNLRVVNYSTPVDMEVSYEELVPHLHYITEMPEAIPYITSYYKETWGFCLTFNEFQSLEKTGKYKVVIQSTLLAGSLTYGEAILQGSSAKEILFSTYLCHPSMANNELSGPLVQAFLYQKISAIKNRRYTYRFVFAPETIGVISYLFNEGEGLKKNLEAGYVLTCCGDNGKLVYKKSKRGNAASDTTALHVLRNQKLPFEVIPFSVGGSDERQYCSSGFNLPVGSLTRSMYQRYKEYHTSLDNKSFISFEAMVETVEVYYAMAMALEQNQYYKCTVPNCEPQLGKRGLYPSSVGPTESRHALHNMMHLISYADGSISLMEIAELRNCSVFEFSEIAEKLELAGVLKKMS